MDWILPLEKVDLSHVAAVGGKAARLGALAQAGFDVPGGIVVTADAFHAHMSPLQDERPNAPRLLPEFLNALAVHIKDGFSANTIFAVRSSAVDEDGVDASFAGQHATYYYVNASKLPTAVVDCWLSLWSEAAMAYRARWREPPQAMAVIVQEMVFADSAGVSFSRDPTHKADGVVIEATWGLGATLVDGHVSADRMRVDPRGRVHTIHVADKKVMVPSDLKDPSVSRLDPVPDHMRRARVLSAKQAREIAEATAQIQDLFNEPVDVEWAYAARRLKLLQARPITGMDESPHPTERLVLFKPVAENFSEPLTPLSEDLYRRFLPKIGRFVEGRLYVNFDLLRAVLPLKGSDRRIAELLLLRQQAALRISWPRVPVVLLATALAYLTSGVFWHRSARLQEDALAPFDDKVDEELLATNKDAQRSLRSLLLPPHPFLPIHRYIFAINVSAGRYFLLLGLLGRLLARWAPDFDRELLPSLTHGGNDMRSTQMVEAIAQLAQTAAHHEDARAAISSPTPLPALTALPSEHPFNRHLALFLNEYGHRGSRELELAAPRWREDVGALLPMIRNQMQQRDSGTDQAYARHLAARDEMHQKLPSGWRRRIVDYIIRRIRYYIVLRENTRHYHTKAFDVARQKIQALEHSLITAGSLNSPGDAFYLTWTELSDLVRGRMDAITASQTVRVRRIEWQQRAKTVPPDQFNLPAAMVDDTELSGVCACPGVVEGTARVVLTLADADQLQPGDVLVTPYTDPAWTPLFPPLAGIVVGTGSYLSHAGTVAREYQIPCVVDVKGCTDEIADGARVRVDATEGRITILQKAA